MKDKVLHNLETSELQKGGATYPDFLSRIPLHVRGDVIGGVPGVSKAQFAKLLKLVGSKFWLHHSGPFVLCQTMGIEGEQIPYKSKSSSIPSNPPPIPMILG